jgi:signal transduction histidine kinase/ActR/RegA family two-component response regulator
VASQQAQLVAVLGALVALLAGLGFALYLGRLLRHVTGQAAVLERTLAEREQADLALQDREGQLRQAQKMEAVGRLAGGVAHDFNNMLAAITGYGSLALAGIEPEQVRVRHALEQVQVAAGRAAALTAQLLSFSRQQVLQPKVLEINQLVSGLTGMLGPLLGASIRLRVDLDPRAGAVEADPGQLEQVITNLVVNGRDAMPAGGEITISTGPADPAEVPAALAPGHYLALTVADSGEGMDEQTQSRALDPFFTTKEQGKGTGLGLATVHGIVTQSGGELRIESRPGCGTTIVVYLPCSEASPAQPTAAPASAPAGGSETVLLVEDDQVIQALLLEVLSQEGYDVLAASDGAQALALAARSELHLDLLITDMTMPGMSGRELAHRIQPLQPGLPVIYISGYSQDPTLGEDAQAGRITYLQKPFTPTDILRTIRTTLTPPGTHTNTNLAAQLP